MATVRFTSALERFLAAPPADVAGATVGEALAAVFEARPALRGYVLDDQGALRRHVAVYIDGKAVRDRIKRGAPVTRSNETSKSPLSLIDWRARDV